MLHTHSSPSVKPVENTVFIGHYVFCVIWNMPSYNPKKSVPTPWAIGTRSKVACHAAFGHWQSVYVYRNFRAN